MKRPFCTNGLLRWCGLLAALLAVVSAGWYWLGKPAVTVFPEETIEVGEYTYAYRLVVPDALPGEGRIPVVFAFHGALDTTEQAAEYMQLDRLAADACVYVVYPQGRHLGWPPFIPEGNPECIEPDLQMFETLCDELIDHYRADPDRMYAVGVSQGGAFVCLLAARRSERLAAAVVHSGWLPQPLPTTGIHAARKCPIAFVAGSVDRQIPPEVVREAHDCFEREGHPTEFWLLEGIGHRWALPCDINSRVWAYLARHSRDGEAGRDPLAGISELGQ